jgi:hypothetical protein
MRYYRIIIVGAPPAFVPAPDGSTWTSQAYGKNDPGAQQIEFQIEEWNPQVVSPDAVLTVHGVSWEQIKQSANLIGKTIFIYAGMAPGLPLATYQSRVAGLIVEGKIARCWGNWIGTETSIGMSFLPSGVYQSGTAESERPGSSGPAGGGGGGGGGGSPIQQSVRVNRTGFRSIDQRPASRVPTVRATDVGGVLSESVLGEASSTVGGITTMLFGGGGSNPLVSPLNIIHNMMPNIPLSSAMQETLSKAFPQASINTLISSGLKLPYQDAGVHQSVEQYIGYINKISHSILGTKNYLGVNISSFSKTINVWDGTSPVSEGEITFLDLIGQPTWIGVNMVSVKTVLRCDLRVGSRVTIPQTLMGVQSDAILPMAPASAQRTNLSFTGTFIVRRVLYIGDFRNPDGASWSTNYELILQGATVGQNDASSAVDQSNISQHPELLPADFFPKQLAEGVIPLSSPAIAAQQRFLNRRVRKYYG